MSRQASWGFRANQIDEQNHFSLSVLLVGYLKEDFFLNMTIHAAKVLGRRDGAPVVAADSRLDCKLAE